MPTPVTYLRRRETKSVLAVCCLLLICLIAGETSAFDTEHDAAVAPPPARRRGTQRLGQRVAAALSNSSSPGGEGVDEDSEDPEGMLSSQEREASGRTIQFTSLSMTRKRAVNLYLRFCPSFSWFYRKGCDPTRGTNPNTIRLCGYSHTLFRNRLVRDDDRRELTFLYRASRAGVSYDSRNIRIVCPYDAPPNGNCRVHNVLCQAPLTPAPARLSPSPRRPTVAPAARQPTTTKPPTPRPSRAPSAFPSSSPTPVGRLCRSCLTGQNWTCPFAEKCGCNLGNCLPPGSRNAVCSCETMVPLVWNAQNEAVIEHCQDPSDDATFGYRLPGQDSCHLAAIMIRTRPGVNYRLTLRNLAMDPTNLHTHGPHISGDGNGDNPFRSVESGGCINYYWDIPSDHMGGTHWMHSHHKKSGLRQMNGGAMAMFIVEENPELLDNVDAASKPGLQRWLNNELLLLASRTAQFGQQGNGLKPARYTVTLNEWYRLRIVGVEMDGKSWRLRMPFGCTVLPMAHDGVWRFTVPGPPLGTEVRMTPAGRLDVAIRCTRRGPLQITAVSDVVSSETVAILNVTSGTNSVATPFTSNNGTWTPKRPAYLQDLSADDPDQRFNINITISTINGGKFVNETYPVPEVVQYGSLQEWTLNSAFDPHSFHQHVQHFQVVNCSGFNAGEFYDTIQPNTTAPCTIRTRLSDYGGNLFVHCHTVAHSQGGAAKLFHVEGGGIVNPDTDMEEFVC